MNANALFAAAREDAPDAAERAAMFRGIGLATGIATGAAAAAISVAPATTAATAASAAAGAAEAATVAKATASGGAFGMKLLALGAVLGAASTAFGVILAITVVASDAPQAAVGTRRTVATTAGPATVGTGTRLGQVVTRHRDTSEASAKASADANAEANVEANANANAVAAPSDLGEEARLVTAARSALMAGDPARALALVQATRKLSARSLEPEELGLEARALRALGRADDAAATELVLRRRYPEHALAR